MSSNKGCVKFPLARMSYRPNNPEWNGRKSQKNYYKLTSIDFLHQVFKRECLVIPMVVEGEGW